MQIFKWLCIASIITLIVSCFLPWVSIPLRQIAVTGMHAEAMNFGKPGLLHIIFGVTVLAFVLANKIWSLKTAFFISAINIAWAVRNYMLLSSCSGGICPEKHTGIYLVLISSALSLLFLLFIGKNTEGGT